MQILQMIAESTFTVNISNYMSSITEVENARN